MVTTWFLDETPGRTPLWQVFWIYGVLASHLLFGSILYLFRAVDTTTLALMLTGFVLYTAWIMRTVWRNAFTDVFSCFRAPRHPPSFYAQACSPSGTLIANSW